MNSQPVAMIVQGFEFAVILREGLAVFMMAEQRMLSLKACERSGSR